MVNSPRWEEISSIGFSVIYPTGYANTLWIDDVYFDQLQIVARKGDTVSIAKYGPRKGPSLNDGNIFTDEQAEAIADIMLAIYSKPRLNIEGVETEDTFDFPLGYKCTIVLNNNTLVGEIREIVYTFDGKMLTESANIS